EISNCTLGSLLNVLVLISLPFVSYIFISSIPKFSLLVMFIIFLAGLGYKLNLSEIKFFISAVGALFIADIFMLSILIFMVPAKLCEPMFTNEIFSGPSICGES